MQLCVCRKQKLLKGLEKGKQALQREQSKTALLLLPWCCAGSYYCCQLLLEASREAKLTGTEECCGYTQHVQLHIRGREASTREEPCRHGAPTEERPWSGRGAQTSSCASLLSDLRLTVTNQILPYFVALSPAKWYTLASSLAAFSLTQNTQ